MNFKVSIKDSINRILKTPLGSRVMRPNFGSLLYTLRDREFNDEYRLLAKKYTYEAIINNEPRVKVENVDFKVEPVNGVVTLVIILTNGEIIEVEND
ncbi:GPW/gp25 family protein [Sulfurimonas sp.]|uniref:GPW/gp25 family protein n=1 Tax=Sulfurimonas sp. TaxID=2022749 RepID=UPI0026004C69|nr:GPW/gp25 family protein [Sulfurimonas sp.]